ncbi:MAG: NAD(P)-dependent oxidoreductase, partial [Polaromonas sp.]|nr:NAD(P)-dependent oxidoreductase [Polaromonas sp.]
MKFEHVGMVGYGEVGKIFTAGLKDRVSAVSVWDLKFDTPGSREAHLAQAAQAGVAACGPMAELCVKSDLLISAV